MSKCNCYECNPYGEPEPDQIDMMGADELRSEFRILLKQRGELGAKYEELLYSVSMKYPNETRHETALRYIKKAEEPSQICAGATP
jgi:hypothetical protein